MNFFEYLEFEHTSVPGWCSAEKATSIYELIKRTKASLCVEIGVFGGSSFFPQAIAIQELGFGKVAGIDPWKTTCAVESMCNVENIHWWSSVDLESICHDFMSRRSRLGLDGCTAILREKSADAAGSFADDSINVLHIDGNHSESISSSDAFLYLPKVKLQGHIFFDDIFWIEKGEVPSTNKALNYLLEFCDPVRHVGKDCLLLRKRANP